MDVDRQAQAQDNQLNLPKIERDPMKPLCIAAGCDNMLKIGEP